MAGLVSFEGCCGMGILHSIKSVPTKKIITDFVARAGTMWGIIVFTDNAQVLSLTDMSNGKFVLTQTPHNAGQLWAKFIREQGYRVDEHFLGGNPNHQEQEPHILTMYLWFLNKEKNKESVYVGKQPEKTATSDKPGVPP